MTGTVLVVTSGKGGVGKTTTTLNLGVALRGSGYSVALVDGDLGMANLAPMLGIEASATLHDVLAGEATVEDATLEEADEFGIVPGARNLEAFASIDPGELPGVLSTLVERYEYVVVDAGPGVHYESTLPIEAADEVVLVTTPASTSIEDTRKVAELAGMMNCTVRGAVINRATDGTEPEGIAAELGVDLLAVVPADSVVRESTDAGVPIERYAPESPAAAAYRRLADVLTGVDDSAEPVVGESRPEGSASEGDDGSFEERSAEAEGDHSEGGGKTDAGTDGGENRDSEGTVEGEDDRDHAGAIHEEDGEGGDEKEEHEEGNGSGLFGRLRGLF